MGALTQLRQELEGLAGELDEAVQLSDVAVQPEVVRARAVVDEARTALSSAFLSRRAMVVAKEAIDRAQSAVREALALSAVLRERAARLRSDAGEIRSAGATVRETGDTVGAWSQRLKDEAAAPHGHVVIESGVPPDHHEKAGIEAAIARTLGLAGGDWKVWVTVPPGARWWGLRVRGPAIDWVGTLQDAEEQTADGIRARLEPLARVAIAEGLVRNGRRRRPAPRGTD